MKSLNSHLRYLKLNKNFISQESLISPGPNPPPLVDGAHVMKTKQIIYHIVGIRVSDFEHFIVRAYNVFVGVFAF